MAQTTYTIPSIANFKYPPSSLHICLYCERIVIDPSTPDTVHDRNYATFVNSFMFEYAEVVKAGHDGCLLLLPVLEAIQSPLNQPQNTSQPRSELLAGTLFIDIHIKYQQAKKTSSESTNLCHAQIWWRQADRNIPSDQGSPVVTSGTYSISAELDDLAAKYISQRPQYPWINTISTFQSIGECIQKCNTRAECLKVLDRKDSTRFNRRPSRMILVGASNMENVKIVNPKSNVKYIALSYCWGEDDSMRLTRADLYTWQQAIAISRLPKTIQDAIISTRLLGFEYLWVDRLCIIQDDPADIHQEIAAMPEVYRRATLTISASSAKSSNEGFLHTSTATYQKLDQSLVALRYRCSDARYGRAILNRQTARDDLVDTRSPVNRRAWIMQEQMLSTRLVQFGSEQIHWICKCFAFKQWHNGIEIKTEAQDKGNFYQPRDMDFEWAWASIVVDYTQRALSVQTDKLLAIAAVAQDISMRIDEPTRYLAGIWQHQLPKNLMWRVYGEKKRLRPSSYRSPSWSWASVDGEITPDYFGWETSYTILLTIRQCTVTPVSPILPFGAVFSGYITVSGRLRKMNLDVDTYILASSTVENEGEFLQGLPDACDENIPGNLTGKWRLVSCLEVGYKFIEGGNDKDPQPCYPFGLILTAPTGCHHTSRGYVDEEAGTKFSAEEVFQRVGVFESENLVTSKIISFENCPVKEITVV